MQSSFRQRLDAVRLPLQAGWTALHAAAVKGHVDIATLLLNEGADANAEDKVLCMPCCEA